MVFHPEKAYKGGEDASLIMSCKTVFGEYPLQLPSTLPPSTVSLDPKLVLLFNERSVRELVVAEVL